MLKIVAFLEYYHFILQFFSINIFHHLLKIMISFNANVSTQSVNSTEFVVFIVNNFLIYWHEVAPNVQLTLISLTILTFRLTLKHEPHVVQCLIRIAVVHLCITS